MHHSDSGGDSIPVSQNRPGCYIEASTIDRHEGHSLVHSSACPSIGRVDDHLYLYRYIRPDYLWRCIWAGLTQSERTVRHRLSIRMTQSIGSSSPDNGTQPSGAGQLNSVWDLSHRLELSCGAGGGGSQICAKGGGGGQKQNRPRTRLNRIEMNCSGGSGRPDHS